MAKKKTTKTKRRAPNPIHAAVAYFHGQGAGEEALSLAEAEDEARTLGWRVEWTRRGAMLVDRKGVTLASYAGDYTDLPASEHRTIAAELALGAMSE